MGAVDAEPIREAVNRAAAAGIPVIVLNRLEPWASADVAAYVGIDNTAVGTLAAYAAVNSLGGPGVLAGSRNVQAGPEVFLDLPWWQRLYEAFDPAGVSGRVAVIEGISGKWRGDNRLRRRGGGPVEVESITYPVWGEPGAFTGLVATFRDATERRRMETELRQREYLLRKSQETALLGSFSVDLTTGRWVGSPMLDRLLGISGDYPRDVEGLMALIHPAHRGEELKALLEGPAADAAPLSWELRIVRHDDARERWVSVALERECDVDGEVRRVIGTIQDITERRKTRDQLESLNRQLEERVAERTALLEAANRELEAFAYSVSHDLRAPLRAIDGYTRMLTEDYGPMLTSEGQRICSILRDETVRMGRLIDDLLLFSRLGRSAMRLSSVDMEAAARAAFEEVAAAEERGRVDLEIHPLPEAWGDPAVLKQVWANLLSNALKFSSRQPRPRIVVSATREPRRIVYCVADNGVGFDVRYAHKLFKVFQRLHSERDYPGTGVGLAIVDRAVRRHGGEVWAHAERDKGAAFFFALPVKPQEGD